MTKGMPTISFGIEFEFDVINDRGERVTSGLPRRYFCVEGWGYQNDPTATVELRSPVFTSVEEAVESISREFTEWCEANTYAFERFAPYSFNENGVSLGQHVHVGLPSRRLSRAEKRAIGTRVARVYPLLTGLHMQPIPSYRGLRSTYCSAMWFYDYRIPNEDHFCEISDSHNGTVEFRIFDSNIPQTTLTCVTFLREIAKVALREGAIELDDDFKRRYRNDRTNVLRRGLVGINVCEYLREVERQVGDFDLPNVNAIRELLYLASRYCLNAYNVFSLVRPPKFHYFYKMFTNPSEFLNNLMEFASGRNRNRIERWINEAHRVERLSDLVRIAEETQRALGRGVIEATQVTERALPRSIVREAIEASSYYIARIHGVRGYTIEEVAQAIENLLRSHGDGNVNVMSAEEIINSPSRFYVFVIPRENEERDQIVGVIAVRVRTGEIHSLVVDRRYRRLGIARRLLEHVHRVLSIENRERAFAHVRTNNEASRRLFES